MSNKKSKNWFIYGGGLIILSVITLFFIFPGLGASIWSTIANQPSHCSETPYDSECYCEQGERKIYVPWVGVPKWSCENVEQLLLDPESPTFEEDAIKFAQDYLALYCGDVCTDLDCGPVCEYYDKTTNSTIKNEWEDRCIDAVWGYGNSGARLVNIECKVVTEWEYSSTPCEVESDCNGLAWEHCYQGRCVMQKGGYNPWRMEFFVDSETEIPTTLEVFSRDNYCYDVGTNKKCAHQSVCNSENNLDLCVGDLPLTIVPNDHFMSVLGISGIGSGYTTQR
ncbi:MAG: hypothetical protein DRP06_01705 [Candidatus Aenigmatarchaeota archaeon]|nr:MAG: hypothetical protein DRP06_01705 [Candidatus Aenigmarchaeota archaeon]